MNESKVRTTIGMCVIALTKHIMVKDNLDYETAFKKLLSTQLYSLLKDSDTRLFFETNAYLIKAYDIEDKQGIDAMYEYINV